MLRMFLLVSLTSMFVYKVGYSQGSWGSCPTGDLCTPTCELYNDPTTGEPLKWKIEERTSIERDLAEWCSTFFCVFDDTDGQPKCQEPRTDEQKGQAEVKKKEVEVKRFPPDPTTPSTTPRTRGGRISTGVMTFPGLRLTLLTLSLTFVLIL